MMNQVEEAVRMIPVVCYQGFTRLSEKLAGHGLNSSLPTRSVPSHLTEATDLVTLEALTSSKAKPEGKENGFSVLLRVTGPPQTQAPRASVDVIAVLDISKSMDQDDRLERMKEAMRTVISKLGEEDRLSIVCFHEAASCLTDLTAMSGKGPETATDAINKLAIGDRHHTSSNMAAGLDEAAQVLRGRQGERSSRVGCIILLSDAADCPNIKEQTICTEYRVHTFGLGPRHNPSALKHIADRTLGTYSLVKKNIAEAFALFVAGFKSVAATSVHITLSAHEEDTISSIEAGGFVTSILDDGKSREIKIPDIYAGETKSFVVNLKSTIGNGKLLTVAGRYQSLAGESKVLASIQVLQPPSTEEPEIPAVAAAEHSRVELLKAQMERLEEVLKMQAKPIGDEDGLEPNGMSGGDRLQQVWVDFKASVASGGYPVPEDVARMDRFTSSRDGGSEYEDESDDERRSTLLAYMMSWLSCHQLQRANTMGTPSSSGAFAVVLVASDPNDHATVDAPRYNVGRYFFCLHRHREHAVLLVPFLLLASMLYLYSRGRGGFDIDFSGDLMINLPTSTTTALDLSGHPHWPVMEQDLQVMIRKTEELEVTTFFKEASVEAMNDQMDQYLYLAIVHATVLRRRHAGYAISDAVAVRSEAANYLRNMVERMRDVHLPSFQDPSLKLNEEINRYLYSTIVQSSVVWSHTKDFHTDSMITEVVTDENSTTVFTVVDGVVVTDKVSVPTVDDKTVVVIAENETAMIVSTNETSQVVVALTTEMANVTVFTAEMMANATVRITELEQQLEQKESLETQVAKLKLELVGKTRLENRVAQLEKEMAHKATLEVHVKKVEQQLREEKTTVVSLRRELETQRKSCTDRCNVCDTNVKRCGEMVEMWKARVVELGGSIEEEEAQGTVAV